MASVDQAPIDLLILDFDDEDRDEPGETITIRLRREVAEAMVADIATPEDDPMKRELREHPDEGVLVRLTLGPATMQDVRRHLQPGETEEDALNDVFALSFMARTEMPRPGT